jgi:hypothetical protein
VKRIIDYLTHKYGVRLVAMVALLWLFIEGVRIYYSQAEMGRFFDLADLLMGPWLIAFLVAAFGDPMKQMATGFYERMRAMRIEAERREK